MLALSKVAVGLGSLFVWSGRAGRSEFWAVFLAYVLVVIVTPMVAFVTYSFEYSDAGQHAVKVLLPQLTMLYLLLATGCRRLHDTGRSGWWQVLPVGICVALVVIAWANTARDDKLFYYLPYTGLSLLFLAFCYAQRGVPASARAAIAQAN